MACSSGQLPILANCDLPSYWKVHADHRVGDQLALLPAQVHALLATLPDDARSIYRIQKHANPGSDMHLQSKLQRCADKYDGFRHRPMPVPVRIRSGSGRQAVIAYPIEALVIFLWGELVDAFDKYAKDISKLKQTKESSDSCKRLEDMFRDDTTSGASLVRLIVSGLP